MRLRSVLPLLLLAAGSCTATQTATRPASLPPERPAAARDSLQGPWRLRNLGRPRAVVVELHAVVQSTIDTLTREDTIASRSVLEWSAAADAPPLRLLGMVREFAVRDGSDSAWMPVPLVVLPVTFTALYERRGDHPQFLQPDATACDARAAAVQALREAWVDPPRELARGVRWSDSSVAILCRDGIPLSVQTRRDFEVLGATVQNGALALQLRRETLSRVVGRGVQFGDSVVVQGEGQGSATLLLSLDGAVVLAADGTSALRLELRGRRRTQQLVQTGALVLRAP